jgi:sigma-B regulation protein RsbU (phosphoserine phosphatase)
MRLLAPLLAAVTAALLLAGAADMPRRPYLGFALRGDDVALVDPGSPAERAGLRPGDLLLGATLRAPRDSTRAPAAIAPGELWRAPRGAVVTLALRRGDTATTVGFELSAPPPLESLRRGLNLLVAAVFLVVGVLTWRHRPDPLGWAFLLLCLSLAAIFRPGLPPGPGWLSLLDGLLAETAAYVFAASLLEFVHRLPTGRLTRGGRLVTRTAWGTAGVLLAAGVLLRARPEWPDPVLAAIAAVALLFVAAALLGALVRLLRELARTRDRADALRLRVVFWGGAVGLTPLTIVFLLRNLTRGPLLPGETFAVLAVALLPLAWMYAILRHRIFDIRILLRRGVVGFLVTTLLAAAGFALVTLLGPRLDPARGHPAVTALAVALIAVAFSGTRHAVQGLVDRSLFRAGVSRRRRIEELSGSISGWLDAERIPESLLLELTERLDASRAAVLAASAAPVASGSRAGNDGAGAPNGAQNGGPPPPAAPPRPLLPRVLEELIEPADRPVTRQDLVERAPAETRAAVVERLEELGWELYVPLREGQRLVAVAAFELARRAGGLDSRELALLRRVSRSASEALTQARRRRDELERERIRGELEVARGIQRHMLPDEPPLTPLVDLAGITLPGEEVGGDAHDFLRLPGGRLGVAVGDVSGKGVPAALLMSSAQASFRAVAETGAAPSAVLAALNRRLLEIDEPERFLCFFYARIDPAAGEFVYSNSGLDPPLLVRADGEVLDLEEGGVILGAFPGALWPEQRIRTEPGDVLLVFSDGLVDAAETEDIPVDRERLIEIVRARPGASAERLRHDILAAGGVMASANPVPLDDDVTLVVVRFH